MNTVWPDTSYECMYVYACVCILLVSQHPVSHPMTHLLLQIVFILVLTVVQLL